MTFVRRDYSAVIFVFVLVLFHRCRLARVIDTRVNTLSYFRGKAWFEFICVTRSVIQHQLSFWRALRDRICPLAHFICPLAHRSPLVVSVSRTILKLSTGAIAQVFPNRDFVLSGSTAHYKRGIAVPAGGKVFPPRFICQSNTPLQFDIDRTEVTCHQSE